jgi:CO/xanthine dehydrogenase Mo-binding subunit
MSGRPPNYENDHGELEQHEVTRLQHLFEVNRRDVFKLLGAGIVIGICVPAALTQESGRSQGENVPQNLDAWLHIGGDGKVTVFTGKAEMGQNIRTSLSQQVAEELHVPMSSITMVMGDTDLTPFDMGTFGSRTTPQMGPQLRDAAAAARELLLDMAAQQWQTQRSELSAENGSITNKKTGQSISYADLTHGQKLVKVMGDDPALTPATEWRIAGTSPAKVDGKEFVTGIHQYTSDISRPGMMHGKVLRPSAFHGTLSSLELNGADKMPGVKVVRDGEFTAIVADSLYSADKALRLLKPQWKAPQQIGEKDLFDYLRKNPDTESRGGFGGRSNHETGSVEKAMTSAAKTLSQTYTVAYIQHAPLEPRAAVAEWREGKLTVWTGTQRPFAVKQELAEAFHLSEDKVRVIVPDTGSAYGGKHTGECAVEAARLAKGAGKPVKLIWTREEEFTWAYFRPAGVIDVKSGIAPDGTLVAWEFHNYNSGPAAIDTPYNVANKKIEFHPTANPPLRQGSYRGLAATANFFARESHMDELAHQIGMDPLEFRLKNITDPRLRAVFETAAEKFGWRKQPSSAERGFGIAGGFEKGSYVAACAEISFDGATRQAKITRVVQAFDCGAVINPQGLKNQISGAIVMGIGGALFEAIHFDNGRVTNPHFYEYRVPRFKDAPKVEVELIDRKDQKSMGAGETPIMALAPAVANAIFNANGKRLRNLPLGVG